MKYNILLVLFTIAPMYCSELPAYCASDRVEKIFEIISRDSGTFDGTTYHVAPFDGHPHIIVCDSRGVTDNPRRRELSQADCSLLQEALQIQKSDSAGNKTVMARYDVTYSLYGNNEKQTDIFASFVKVSSEMEKLIGQSVAAIITMVGPVRSNDALHYCSAPYVDKVSELLSMKIPHNMPFFLLTDDIGKCWPGYCYQDTPVYGDVNYVPNAIGNIRYLPLSLFQKNGELGKVGEWKKNGDELLIIVKEEQTFVLKFMCGDLDLDDFVETFKKRSNNPLKIKDHLIAAGILDGKGGHGPEGYFKEEYAAVKSAQLKAQQEGRERQWWVQLRNGSILCTTCVLVFIVAWMLRSK